MKIVKRTVGDISILELTGNLVQGWDGTNTLRAAVEKELNAGNQKVVLDCGNVHYMDSPGIDELCNTAGSVTALGQQLRVVKLDKKFRNLINIPTLVERFQTYDDEEAALNSFNGKEAKYAN
jgi:anti-sigma B factor antagonist